MLLCLCWAATGQRCTRNPYRPFLSHTSDRRALLKLALPCLSFSLLFYLPWHRNRTEFSVTEILREESNLSSLRARKKRGSCFSQPFPQLLFHYLLYFFTLQTAQRLGARAKPSPFVPCSHRCIFKGKLIPRNAVHAHTYLGAAPTPAHQVTQRPLALAAAFQPAELLLANCYLSNR